MTKLINHRINTRAGLRTAPKQYGIEVDIRSSADRLIIHHDPYTEGEDFAEWLQDYDHGTLILNVKEEGLESRLIELMRSRNITDYFFLDQSFPFLIRWSNKGERRCAVRVSEFEAIETAMTLAGKVDWVWVDCFTKFPISQREAQQLQQSGFKLCLVSPELQGRDAATEIPQLHQLLKQQNIYADAICTKQPALWDELLNDRKN